MERGSTNRNSHKPPIRRDIETVFSEEFDITAPPKAINAADAKPNEKRDSLSGNIQRSILRSTIPIAIRNTPLNTRVLLNCVLKVASLPM